MSSAVCVIVLGFSYAKNYFTLYFDGWKVPQSLVEVVKMPHFGGPQTTLWRRSASVICTQWRSHQELAPGISRYISLPHAVFCSGSEKV